MSLLDINIIEHILARVDDYKLLLVRANSRFFHQKRVYVRVIILKFVVFDIIEYYLTKIVQHNIIVAWKLIVFPERQL